MISFAKARELAESLAESCLANSVLNQPGSWLRDEVFEEDSCWLFLKNKQLVFHSECLGDADVAFVVSKLGTMMTIADFHENEKALKKYLHEISEYLKMRGE